MGDWKVRTLVVGSASVGEGRSVIASNLAIALAEGGRRVLLIDGDLRSPSQALIFGLSGAVGLTNALQASALVEGAIRRTTVTNLNVMPAGPTTASPSDLLNTPALNELLEAFAGSYDHVIIDSPQLGKYDDARILAAGADATLLVVRAGKSNRRHVEDARDALLSVGARVLGVVLNGSKGGSLGGGYNYGAFAAQRPAWLNESDLPAPTTDVRPEPRIRRPAQPAEQERFLPDDETETAPGTF
jgi:capsular exopolysaccharide synthesis family protein